MCVDGKIGSIAVGMEADLVVLDLHSTPILKYRMSFCENREEQLFVLMTMGDDRATRATYVNGALAYDRADQDPEASKLTTDAG